MADAVDRGSLKAIFDSEINPSTTNAQPVLQCVQVKPIPGQQGAPERYRVVFSDINNFVQSMLATQANHVVQDGKLRKGCFVRLKSFQANNVKGKRIIIVLDLEVLEELGECEKIGTPEALETKEEEAKPTTISSGGFYGNMPEQKPPLQDHQPLPSRSNGPSSTSHGTIYPIESLSPYAHKWTIKARVTSKSEIKTWHNKNGEGKLFSVNLLDESGEIKATGFKDQCDAFYELFQEGSVYYITSPCKVQFAKKQFSNLSNDYELTLERDTMVEKAEAQDDVPQIRYNFTSIGDLSNLEKDAVIDTIGVLTDIDEAHKLKGWYDAQGRTTEYSKHSNTGGIGAATGQTDTPKTILQIKEENLGMSETNDYFSVKATVIYIKPDNFAYAACLSEGCNKKVVEFEGQWRCEKCDKSHPKPEYRYIMSVNVSDHTGQMWLSSFDETGKMILGMSADELTELRESDPKAATDIFGEANFQTFLFRCRAKMDNYQDTQRVRYQVTQASPANSSNECSRLMNLIKLYD